MEFSPTKLFVCCLPYSKLASDVAEAFELYVEVTVLTDPEGRSKGAAFVTFANKEHAMAAMQGMVGFIFQGSTRPINVSLAHKQNSGPVIQQAVFYQTDVQD
jgi:RNA recognition motif-containing protein